MYLVLVLNDSSMLLISLDYNGLISICNQQSADVIQYDIRMEFHVDSKAECGQLNLAHVARNKKLKQTR